MQALPRFIAISAMILTGTILLGCGGSDGPKYETGTVTGKISSKTGPVPEGAQVEFHFSGGGHTGRSLVATDGTYAITSGIRVGNYSVVVLPPEVKAPEDASIPAPPPQEYPGLKATYRTIETTTAKHEVKAGKNEINLELE